MAVAYVAQKLKCSCFYSIISYSYNVTIVISYYSNLVTFQTITPSYKLLVTKQVPSYITSYFKSNQLRNLVTKVTSYPQLFTPVTACTVFSTLLKIYIYF